jgi:hypothetical protein
MSLSVADSASSDSLAISRPHSTNFVISSIDAAKDFAMAKFGNLLIRITQ